MANRKRGKITTTRARDAGAEANSAKQQEHSKAGTEFQRPSESFQTELEKARQAGHEEVQHLIEGLRGERDRILEDDTSSAEVRTRAEQITGYIARAERAFAELKKGLGEIVAISEAGAETEMQKQCRLLCEKRDALRQRIQALNMRPQDITPFFDLADSGLVGAQELIERGGQVDLSQEVAWLGQVEGWVADQEAMQAASRPNFELHPNDRVLFKNKEYIFVSLEGSTATIESVDGGKQQRQVLVSELNPMIEAHVTPESADSPLALLKQRFAQIESSGQAVNPERVESVRADILSLIDAWQGLRTYLNVTDWEKVTSDKLGEFYLQSSSFQAKYSDMVSQQCEALNLADVTAECKTLASIAGDCHVLLLRAKDVVELAQKKQLADLTQLDEKSLFAHVEADNLNGILNRARTANRPLSHLDIQAYIGVTRVSAERMLADLEQRGLIQSIVGADGSYSVLVSGEKVCTQMLEDVGNNRSDRWTEHLTEDERFQHDIKMANLLFEAHSRFQALGGLLKIQSIDNEFSSQKLLPTAVAGVVWGVDYKMFISQLDELRGDHQTKQFKENITVFSYDRTEDTELAKFLEKNRTNMPLFLAAVNEGCRAYLASAWRHNVNIADVQIGGGVPGRASLLQVDTQEMYNRMDNVAHNVPIRGAEVPSDLVLGDDYEVAASKSTERDDVHPNEYSAPSFEIVDGTEDNTTLIDHIDNREPITIDGKEISVGTIVLDDPGNKCVYRGSFEENGVRQYVFRILEASGDGRFFFASDLSGFRLSRETQAPSSGIDLVKLSPEQTTDYYTALEEISKHHDFTDIMSDSFSFGTLCLRISNEYGDAIFKNAADFKKVVESKWEVIDNEIKRAILQNSKIEPADYAARLGLVRRTLEVIKNADDLYALKKFHLQSQPEYNQQLNLVLSDPGKYLQERYGKSLDLAGLIDRDINKFSFDEITPENKAQKAKKWATLMAFQTEVHKMSILVEEQGSRMRVNVPVQEGEGFPDQGHSGGSAERQVDLGQVVNVSVQEGEGFPDQGHSGGSAERQVDLGQVLKRRFTEIGISQKVLEESPEFQALDLAHQRLVFDDCAQVILGHVQRETHTMKQKKSEDSSWWKRTGKKMWYGFFGVAEILEAKTEHQALEMFRANKTLQKSLIASLTERRKGVVFEKNAEGADQFDSENRPLIDYTGGKISFDMITDAQERTNARAAAEEYNACIREGIGMEVGT